MDERLARKLSPLMPDYVRRLRRAWHFGDSSTRQLIERQLIHTAEKVLGDYLSRPLLSLPSKAKSRGRVQLGAVIYEKERWPFGISHSELLQNMAIFGRSGAGKTNAVFHVLLQLTQQRVPWLFLDWKRTARHLIPLLPDSARASVFTPGRSLLPMSFNPFVSPPNVETPTYIKFVVDLLADAYTLGDGARSLLQKAIQTVSTADGDNLSVQRVLQELEGMPVKSRGHGWKMSAKRALESLAFTPLNTSEPVNQEEQLRRLLEHNTIIELDALSHNDRRFLIPLLCLWIYHVRLASASRESLTLVIVIEEAHHVLHRRGSQAQETVLEMLIRQCREIGIGIVVADQHPSLISQAVLGNTYTSICLNLKDPSDIAKAAAFSQMDDFDRRFLSSLPVGQSVVKLQDRWNSPVLVQIPNVNVGKGSVSDSDLTRLSSRYMTRSERKRLLKPLSDQVRQSRFLDQPLNEDAFHLLEDVNCYRDDGVKRRYKRLGWSVDRGNRMKNLLIERGWLEAATIPLGRTRKVILRLSREGRTTLGLDAKSDVRNESIGHEFWKRFYAKKLSADGWRVEVEAPRRGGSVDVLAKRNRETLAVEIETGMSNVISNVRHCLLSKFDEVLVVVTNRNLLPKIEAMLATASLLGHHRVRVRSV